MKSTISVAISGLGWWARNRTLGPFLRQASRHIQIVGICNILNQDGTLLDSDDDVLVSCLGCALQPGTLNTNLEEALAAAENWPPPRALLINTPTGLHTENALEAIRRGFHVYIERPIATPRDDFKALLRESSKAGVTVFTGVQRRLEAPFQHIRKVIAERQNFGRLESIRCTLHAGHTLEGWRRDKDLAGGGIILDSGHHLLDLAIWIAEAAGIKVPESPKGFVRLADFVANDQAVEQTAAGLIQLTEGVRLAFDFSYKAPQGSIFERLDFRDHEGTQITLTRDQSVRTPLPGLLRHQTRDGTIVSMKEGTSAVLLDDARLAGTAENTGPLNAFFDQVCGEQRDSSSNHPCVANQSEDTWRLVKGIYELARKPLEVANAEIS